MNDRAKALRKLNGLQQSRYPRSKQWRNAGYFDVPGAVMRELTAEGLCETRKRGPADPQEYRP